MMSELMMKWEGLLPLNGLLRKAAIVSGSEVTTTTTSRRRKKSPSYRRSPLIRNPSDSTSFLIAHCDDDNNQNSSPSLWPVRPVVVLNWDQVDEAIREPGIFTGYRAEDCTVGECCRSLFCGTNETLNFWTHFLPTILFVWRTYRLAEQWDYFTDNPDRYGQPFLVYMVTCCLYTFMSAIAHGFSAISSNWRSVSFFLDYAAISFYSFGSGMLYRAYALPDSWMGTTMTEVFLSGCTVLSLAATAITCYSRVMIPDIILQRLLRLLAFTLPYVWDNFPLIIRLVTGVDDTKDYVTKADWLHIAQFVFAMLASFCYASHIPERLLPGRFDLVGHSHNWLHICGALGTYFQMEAGLIDLQDRRSHLLTNGLALMDEWWTLVLPILLLTGHVLLVLGFGRIVYHRSQSECNHPKENNNK